VYFVVRTRGSKCQTRGEAVSECTPPLPRLMKRSSRLGLIVSNNYAVTEHETWILGTLYLHQRQLILVQSCLVFLYCRCQPQLLLIANVHGEVEYLVTGVLRALGWTLAASRVVERNGAIGGMI
jgi:hypothetical protein